MSRILVISDIHSNITALEAVLAAAGTVDSIWCLGDLIGYGPYPNEVVQKIRSLTNITCLLGNHDAAALGTIDLMVFNQDARTAIRWTKEALTAENLEFLQTLPEKTVIDDVTLAHGSPRNPVWEYLLDLHTAASNFSYFETPFCMVGHTHMPIAYFLRGNRKVEWAIPTADKVIHLTDRTILNPGSVGQPRDHDPRAAFAIYDPEEKTWTPHRVEYDIAAVQERFLETDLPHRHSARLKDGW